MKTAKFEVYPDPNSHLYWSVYVCPNRSAMMRIFKRLFVREYKGEKFQACVMPQKRQKIEWGGKTITHPQLGYVLFEMTRFDPEVLAHESVHMATGFLRRARRTVKLGQEADEREENLAYPAGRCARQIVREMVERKLL